ncbi:MAG: glutamate 5-kinase, partial [Armatimonadota bacterium]
MDFKFEAGKPGRIVVKVGTRLVIDSGGQPQRDFLSRTARQIRGLMDAGIEVLLVTSGAVGIGRRIIFDRPGRLLRVNERPSAAAVGQPILMRYWSEAMAEV